LKNTINKKFLAACKLQNVDLEKNGEVNWIDKKTNEQILNMVQDTMKILDTICKHKCKLLGQCYKIYQKEGCYGKKTRGRRWIQL